MRLRNSFSLNWMLWNTKLPRIENLNTINVIATFYKIETTYFTDPVCIQTYEYVYFVSFRYYSIFCNISIFKGSASSVRMPNSVICAIVENNRTQILIGNFELHKFHLNYRLSQYFLSDNGVQHYLLSWP